MRMDTGECDPDSTGPVIMRMESSSSNDDGLEILDESGCLEIPLEFTAQLAEMGFSEEDCQEMYTSIREQIDDSMKAEMEGYITRVGREDATIQGFWDDRVNLGADRAGRANPFDAPSPSPVQGLWKMAFYVAWKEAGGRAATMTEGADEEPLSPQSSSSSSSSDACSSDGEEESGNELNEATCPEGIAEDVWAQLPRKLRQELLFGEGLVLSPEQEENAAFAESLEPSLRAEVFRAADEAFLTALPPHHVLEAYHVRCAGAAREERVSDRRAQAAGSVATSAWRLVESASGAMGRVARSAAEQIPTRRTQEPVTAVMDGVSRMALLQRRPRQPATDATGGVCTMTGRLQCVAVGAQQRLASMTWRHSDRTPTLPESGHNGAVALMHVPGRSD